MKKSLAVAVLLGNTLALVSSWQFAFVTPYRRHCHTSLSAEKTNAEEYLDKLWEEEKLVERDIVVQESMKGNEDDVTKHVVTEMLETALEHVKLMEKDKAKQLKEVDEAFEHDNHEVHESLHESDQQDDLQAMKEEYESACISEYQYLKDKEENIKSLLEQMKKLEP